MNDAFLVRMLDAVADLDEQFEALADRQALPIAVAGDRHSPRTYSIAKYGRPSGVAPASNTLAMAG